jgi:uncharacterized protein (TIGR03435 family)
MARRAGRGPELRRALVLIAAFLIATGSPLWPQAHAPAKKNKETKAPAYEVVSIKPNNSGGGEAVWRNMPDGFRTTNMALSSLVFGAYGIIMESQVSGLPAWVEADRYDVEAKVDEETAEAWEKMPPEERWEQERLMRQSLLADRCQLKVHRETRELPVYELVIAKDGPKMKEADADEMGSETYGSGRIAVRATSIEQLTTNLSGTVGRMIMDKTGLAEKKYDFTLKWTPDERRNPDDADSPSIFTALEEQLGLKLVPAEGPVETLVIDHMERPSAN